MGGMVLETNMVEIINAIDGQTKIEKTEGSLLVQARRTSSTR